VDRLVDAVGQVDDHVGVAGGEVRAEEGRQRSPGRRVEDRVAPVRDQRPGRVGDGRLDTAVHDAVPAGEAAVADVQRAVAQAEVAEDVRAGLTVDQVTELPADDFQLGFVAGIDRDELSARTAPGVFGVAHQQGRAAVDELERQAAIAAVPERVVEDPVRVVQAGRHVDLPALVRQAAADRAVDEPVVARLAPPAVRHRAPGGGEPHRRRLGAGQRVVEVRVGDAVPLVVLVHGPPPNASIRTGLPASTSLGADRGPSQ
jgi:hypothetical protein